MPERMYDPRLQAFIDAAIPAQPDWEDLGLMNPESILHEAHEIVHGDRQADYGSPSNNHGTTAAMMQAHLRRKYRDDSIVFDAEDVCFFHILEKISRDANKSKRDNLVDIAGYAENISMIRQEAQ